jgi:hypothetical protein
MGAAERLKPSRRQRRREALLMAYTSFANQVADILDEHDLSEVDGDEPKPRRTRVAPQYVPTHGQEPSAEARAKAQSLARRRGL